MLEIIIYSAIIGIIGGGCIAAGAARMFHAPEIQSMGAFRTLGELNACNGDPISHFSFGLGFFFSSAASAVATGSLTQDVMHRISELHIGCHTGNDNGLSSGLLHASGYCLAFSHTVADYHKYFLHNLLPPYFYTY